MMGAGKTSIGKIVAKKTHRRFVDTDALIEKKAGMTVTEIFEREGEGGFREHETAVLASLARKRNLIVSTGGGVVVTPENIRIMKKSGTVIWLKRELNTIIANPRIRRRPLLAKNENAIFDIMKVREPLYKNACHFVVHNDNDRMKTVNEILRLAK
jgi:shikimate kinase